MTDISLESRLSSIEHGAVAFRVLDFVFVLLGVVFAGVTALTFQSQLSAGLPYSKVALGLSATGANCVGSFMMFWFLNRTSTLFFTTADLIRETREVV
ncbi:MAG: hypothetical protein ACI8QC_000102 [Planctomycetota bacterium]|jgi:hypothetical protein